jgi:hypothetical protein
VLFVTVKVNTTGCPTASTVVRSAVFTIAGWALCACRPVRGDSALPISRVPTVTFVPTVFQAIVPAAEGGVLTV